MNNNNFLHWNVCNHDQYTPRKKQETNPEIKKRSWSTGQETQLFMWAEFMPECYAREKVPWGRGCLIFYSIQSSRLTFKHFIPIFHYLPRHIQMLNLIYVQWFSVTKSKVLTNIVRAGMNGTPGTMNGNVAVFLGCLMITVKDETIIKPKIQERVIAQTSPELRYDFVWVRQIFRAIMDTVNKNAPTRAWKLVVLSGSVVTFDDSSSLLSTRW